MRIRSTLTTDPYIGSVRFSRFYTFSVSFVFLNVPSFVSSVQLPLANSRPKFTAGAAKAGAGVAE